MSEWVKIIDGLRLTERQRELICTLAWYAEDQYKIVGAWARPMDLGGTDASYHSPTLRQLVNKGLARRRDRGGWGRRGSWRYKPTPRGIEVARALRLAR